MASADIELAPLCIYSPEPNVQSISGDELKCRLCGEDERINEMKAVVISISGRYRKGKSFLMDYIKRYLRANRDPDWLDDRDSELTGFLWKSSRERVTRGVLVWPEVFKIRQPDNSELAVILIDTEGMHSSQASEADDRRIFSLSLLLSSMPIFNVAGDIQGDDYKNLEHFVTFGSYISQTAYRGSESEAGISDKPFQELIFLVRDWVHSETYGWTAGEELIEEDLNRVDLPEESKEIRRNIKDAFELTGCFLMSEIGGKVLRKGSNFKGSVKEMKPLFVQHLREFIEGLFSPERLKVKRVRGWELTVGDFCEFVDHYARVHLWDDLPEPRSLFDVTVDAHCSTVIKACEALYLLHMEGIPGGVDPDDFNQRHRHAEQVAMEHFEETVCMGTPKQKDRNAQQLKGAIRNIYGRLENENNTNLELRRVKEERDRLAREKTDREERTRRNKEKNEINQKRTEIVKTLSSAVSIGCAVAAANSPVKYARLGYAAVGMISTIVHEIASKNESPDSDK